MPNMTSVRIRALWFAVGVAVGALTTVAIQQWNVMSI